METKTKNIAFWIMILAVIALCIYLIVFMKTESYKCLLSPLTYGVAHYDSTGGEMVCTCSNINSRKAIYVTKEDITLYDK